MLLCLYFSQGWARHVEARGRNEAETLVRLETETFRSRPNLFYYYYAAVSVGAIDTTV